MEIFISVGWRIIFLNFLLLVFSDKQYDYKLISLSYTPNINLSSEENLKKRIIYISSVYIILTFLIFMLLNFSNIRLFNSLNLSMTLISNGGFLPSNSLDLIIKTFFQKIILSISLLISLINIFILLNIFNFKKVN